MGQTYSTVASTSSYLVSWRTFAILLLLLNAKSIPGSWTYRVLYHFFTSQRRELSRIRKQQFHQPPGLIPAKPLKSTPSDSISLHPLFTPETITTHAPLLEIDYNLHKSNSTYFIDVDISRAKLMGRIVGSVWPLDTVPLQIDPSKASSQKSTSTNHSKARAAVILGAVHTSFRREIAPYTSYQVQSRVVSWDNRWIYIGTWFLQPPKSKSTDPKPTILASSLSKYIVKKGRITVRPVDIFRTVGWIPTISESSSIVSSSLSTGHTTPDEASALSTSIDDAVLVTQRGAAKAVNEAATTTTTTTTEPAIPEPDTSLQWTYEEIESERQRGLKLVESWNSLDGSLELEFLRLA